jgi:SAM-dependent methyltransferase
METSKLFDDKADLYASARPMYPKELFEFIASLVQPHSSAWDCATGNGQAAIGLAKYFSRVEATDISQEQIDNAFQGQNIQYSVQPSESTRFVDDQFDLVNVAQALHWFDYEKYWNEVARVLKPAGVFVAFSYVWPNINRDIDQIVEDYIKKVIEPYWAPNNRLVWDSYRSLELPFKTIPCPNIDLENHWDLVQFLNYIHTWSATRRCMSDIGNGFFEEARGALQSAWGESEEKRLVRQPLTIIAGRAWT